jgi:hypothetical protein
MPPRALKALPGEIASVEDDTSLYNGIKNLALSYFDTTSAFNKVAESSLYKTAKKHFDFQTVKGLDWQEAVGKIMGEDNIKEFGESGKNMVKTALKMGVGEMAGEFSLGQTVISTLADMIIDSATEAFSSEKPVQEQFLEGTWIYIDRGKKQTKQHKREEMWAESSMFGDSDDVLTSDSAREFYSPGFYINHVHGTNNHLVYSFDVEQPLAVNFQDVREATAEDKKRYDRDERLTLIREMFFLRDERDNLKTTKFQIGDEALFGKDSYTVIAIDQETATLKDPDNNVINVDPQACTKGELTHWTSQAPGMFRTAEFTFAPGDFAYREIQSDDVTPTKRAAGILTCIRALVETYVCCVDVWTGKEVKIDPQRLLKPPLPVKRYLDTNSFHTFRREVLHGYDQSIPGVLHQEKHEEVCYAYDQLLAFPVVQTVMTTPSAVQLVTEEVINYDPKAVEYEPPPTTEMSPLMLPIAVCLAIAFVLF